MFCRNHLLAEGITYFETEQWRHDCLNGQPIVNHLATEHLSACFLLMSNINFKGSAVVFVVGCLALKCWS
jgi:hypothetical protein